MTMVEGSIDLTGYHVWWVVTDSTMIPFQGPDAANRAAEYMNSVSCYSL